VDGRPDAPAAAAQHVTLLRDLYPLSSRMECVRALARRKLGPRDRVQAVVYGYEHGLVEPGVPDRPPAHPQPFHDPFGFFPHEGKNPNGSSF